MAVLLVGSWTDHRLAPRPLHRRTGRHSFLHGQRSRRRFPVPILHLQKISKLFLGGKSCFKSANLPRLGNIFAPSPLRIHSSFCSGCRFFLKKRVHHFCSKLFLSRHFAPQILDTADPPDSAAAVDSAAIGLGAISEHQRHPDPPLATHVASSVFSVCCG